MSLGLAFANQSYGTVVAWYNFQNGSNPGVVTDNSLNGHTGTVVGNAAYATPMPGAPSFIHGAMIFAGGNDGVNLNITGTAHPFSELTTSGNNAFTVSFWEYGDSSQPDQQFAFFANGTGGRAISSHAPWSDGVVYFDTAGFSNANQRLTSPGAVPSSDYKGAWNEYTYTLDSSGNKAIYINGTLISSSTGNLSVGSITDFTIGNVDTGGLGYHGQLADFIVFNNALTQTQVTQLFTVGPGAFVPEPSSMILCGLGAVGLLVAVRRRRLQTVLACCLVLFALTHAASAAPVDVLLSSQGGVADINGVTGTGASYSNTSGAPNLNDGNTDGVYGDNSVAHSATGMQPVGSFVPNYMEVTMPETHLLSTVEVFNRTDCCSGRIDNSGATPYTLTIYNGTPGPGTITFTENLKFTPAASLTGPNESGQIINLPTGGVLGDVVRITQNNNDYMNLAELKAFTPEPSSFVLAGLGAIGLLAAARRRRKA
jgi:hypothetical protein